MKNISFKVTDEEYAFISTLLSRRHMDLPTLFLSPLGLREKHFTPTFSFIKRRINQRIPKGASFTLKDWFSDIEYSRLSFKDKSAAGRRLELIVSRSERIKKLSYQFEGRSYYKRLS